MLQDISSKSAKVLSFITICLAIAVKSSGSDDPGKNGRFFTNAGISFFTQYQSGPMALTPNYSVALPNTPGGSPGGYIYSPTQMGNYTLKYNSISILSYSLGLRYNLVEMNKNASLSVSASPTIGWTISTLSSSYVPINPTSGSTSMNATINVPAFLEFNYGNVSTFKSDKDMGFVFGLGYEFNMAPVIPISSVIPVVPGPDGKGNVTMNTKPAWVEPAVEFGIRFWSKQSRAREVNLKYGFGSGTSYLDTSNTMQKTSSPWTIKLTYILYINY